MDTRMHAIILVSFFFFQAEDGIRDLTVTGVQTCALPILGIVDLQPLTGVNTSANDINDNGEIVGGGDTGFGDFHAYFLSAGTSFDLGTLGGNESEALAVNGRGQVAGHSPRGGARAAPKHTPVPAAPGTMIDLGSLGGATSVAHDRNDRGEVAGMA